MTQQTTAMMAGWLRTSAAFMLCAALAACEAVPNKPASATSKAAPETSALPSTPAAAPAPIIDTPEPAEMIGWSDAKTATMLGAASLVRRDLSSEIWQYQAPDCVLFLFLYPDGGVSKIKHVEARSKAGGDIKACVTAVLRQRLSAKSQPKMPKT